MKRVFKRPERLEDLSALRPEVARQIDLLIVGAGPCGLAAAIACGRAGLRAVVLDRGCLVSGVAAYPPYMTFFSTAERIASDEGKRKLEIAVVLCGDPTKSLGSVAEQECLRVIAALEQCGWVQAKAARMLDMTPRQIAYRIQTLNISVKQI